MIKKSTKRLSVKREILQHLELGNVIGAGPPPTAPVLCSKPVTTGCGEVSDACATHRCVVLSILCNTTTAEV